MRRTVHMFTTLHRFLGSFGGRLFVASILALTLPSFVEFSNYAFALETARAKEDAVRSIAAKLKVDPEFLLHPERREKKSVALVASLRGLLPSLFAPSPAPAAAV